MHKIFVAALLPVASLLSASVLAQTLANRPPDVTVNSRYTYAQAAYVPQRKLKLEGARGIDSDGFSGNLSYHFVNSSYVFARGDFTDLDSPARVDASGDYDTYSIGLGFRGPLADTRPDNPDYGKMDIYAEFSYESLELDTSAGSGAEHVAGELDGNGYGAAVGIRWLALPAIEVNPYVGYVEYDSPSTTTRFKGDSQRFEADEDLDGVRYGLRTVYDFSRQFSAVFGYERSDLEIGNADFTTDTVRLGIRWYFPSHGFGAAF